MQTCGDREDHVETQGEDSHPQVKKRDLEEILPSQKLSPEGATSANTLIFDF